MGSEDDTAFKDKSKEEKACFPGFGIFCAILSSLIYSCSAIIVKMIDLHPTQLGLSRSAVQFLILLPVMQVKYKTVDIIGVTGYRVVLWLRGFCGSASLIFLYFAIYELPVGNAVTISNLNIILVPFTARLFLRERISALNFIFALVALCGVVLIARPTFLFPDQDASEVTSTIGVMYGLLSAVSLSLAICTIRKLGPVTYPPLNVMYYSFCGSLTTFTILAIVGEFRFPCQHELPFVFILGFLGVIAEILRTLALKMERAGTVSVLGSIKIIIVYVVQITFFGDIPSILSLVGASLVLSSSIGIGIRKILKERKMAKKKQRL